METASTISFSIFPPMTIEQGKNLKHLFAGIRLNEIVALDSSHFNWRESDGHTQVIMRKVVFDFRY